MSRSEGIEIVKEFDGQCGDHYIASFCDYIDITADQFWRQVHNNLNKKLFDLSNDGIIKRKFSVGAGL